jgi:zinc/manganese transport system permease protein
MNFAALDISILWPAFAAGVLVTLTHVPLGMQVLTRGIVFIDLAIAQIAGLGVVFADFAGFEAQGWAVQGFALTAALAGALLLTWTDKHWPDIQEAVIGVSFVLAASGALLLMASNPHGAEHLRDLLVGQILWVSPAKLVLVALLYALLMGIWFMRGRGGGGNDGSRVVFYLVFASAVTISVQLVGLYLVFTTLIVPAIATRRVARRRVFAGYLLSAGGYALGLLISTLTDWPSGPAIIWVLTLLCVLFALAVDRPHRRIGP